MPTDPLGSGRAVAPATIGAFALLTLLTHAANFGFVAVAGRTLTPAGFGALVALLGVVLIGLAPGMAVQALVAAGVLGQPALVDRALGRRLAGVIAAVVLVVVAGAVLVLDVDGWLPLVTIPVAAGLLPLTGINEGLLQGHRRFVALGLVMTTGALVKLATGTAALLTVGDVGTACVAIALGYAAQVAASRWASRHDTPRRDAGARDRAVPTAVALVALLLLLVHVDAVLAPTVLPDLEAGRYGVGVTAARVTFWLPQFAVLLWFPRMVRDTGRRAVSLALLAISGAGGVGAALALVAGPPVATLVFGTELGAVGNDLWQFVLVGAANLAIQVLVLADLARDRRRMAGVLVPALVAVPLGLVVVDPATAGDAATVVALVLLATALLGAGRVLHRGPS